MAALFASCSTACNTIRLHWHMSVHALRALFIEGKSGSLKKARTMHASSTIVFLQNLSHESRTNSLSTSEHLGVCRCLLAAPSGLPFDMPSALGMASASDMASAFDIASAFEMPSALDIAYGMRLLCAQKFSKYCPRSTAHEVLPRCRDTRGRVASQIRDKST